MKTIRLIELFAGYGSQAMALEKLGYDFENHFVCEFDKYAIKAYNAAHGTDFETSNIQNVHASDIDITNRDAVHGTTTTNAHTRASDGRKCPSKPKWGHYMGTRRGGRQGVSRGQWPIRITDGFGGFCYVHQINRCKRNAHAPQDIRL